jgi:hypothetical protein
MTVMRELRAHGQVARARSLPSRAGGWRRYDVLTGFRNTSIGGRKQVGLGSISRYFFLDVFTAALGRAGSYE